MNGRKWLAAVLWAGVIELVTSWPNPPALAAPAGTDKVVHLVLYSMLGVLTMRGAWRGRFAWRPAALVGGGLVFFAAVDEWHQLFIPGRGMELGDWIVDSVGALAGVSFYTLFAGATLARRESKT